MVQSDTSIERKRFLLGFGIFMGIYLLAYAWVLWITPLPSSSAGLFALLSFAAGITAAIGLIFTRHSLVGLGGSLAAILFVVVFAFTWPLMH